MSLSRIFLLLLSIVFSANGLAAQDADDVDPWSELRFLAGSWQGEESGRAGIGKGEREYRFVLDGKFLHATNTSTFEPQEKNPQGEVHQDWQFFSSDADAGTIMFRQFLSEGFVIRYRLDPDEATDGRHVFVSEAIENAPATKARYTLIKENEDRFVETLELTNQQGAFEPVLRNVWTRQRR